MIYKSMRYIRLYETFQDYVDPLTREIFDLTSDIPLGHGFTITGPIEHEQAIQSIVDNLRQYIDAEEAGYSELSRVGMMRTKRHEFIEYALHSDRAKELKELEELGYTLSIKPRPW